MKILHTSDWHIGKQLHKYDLSEDLDLFFAWLIAYIKTENIDVLLVSGDIFDQANHSQAAYKQYYDLLKNLISLDCKIILTGGNHDSPTVLNAPAELLKAFDISVTGGATEELTDMFVGRWTEEFTRSNWYRTCPAVERENLEYSFRIGVAGELHQRVVQDVTHLTDPALIDLGDVQQALDPR